MTEKKENIVKEVSDKTETLLKSAIKGSKVEIAKKEVAIVTEVMDSIVIAKGFTEVGAEECVIVGGECMGIVSMIEDENIKITLLDKSNKIVVGSEVKRTHRPLEIPTGDCLLGRVVDGLGRPLDGQGALGKTTMLPAERPARPIIHRRPVRVPMETGIKVVDSLIPIGRGQRELILGDRQTGKTSIAIDTILHQKGRDVICVYCAIGQRDNSIANVLEVLKSNGAMDYTVIVKASGNELPGQQFIAAYSATTIAEYFMDNGKDVLVVYDDLTRHARAYREISLLLERSPGREAYPGDIFYIHSRLLERSTRLKEEFGGGSITSLPIIETEAENLSAYIPTNVISITDGQLYLSPGQFQKGILPAIDIGKSVSRVGSSAQLKSYKATTGTLGVEFSQFEELEMFALFATKLDDVTKKIIDRGKKLRLLFKQDKYKTVSTEGQIAIFLCFKKGLFDQLETEAEVRKAEQIAIETMQEDFFDVVKTIRKNEKIDDRTIEEFLKAMRKKLKLDTK